jgi:hypothetical protein
MTDTITGDHNHNTQSYLRGIDNHTSASMRICTGDFTDTQKLVKIQIKGIKGSLSTSKV